MCHCVFNCLIQFVLLLCNWKLPTRGYNVEMLSQIWFWPIVQPPTCRVQFYIVVFYYYFPHIAPQKSIQVTPTVHNRAHSFWILISRYTYKMYLFTMIRIFFWKTLVGVSKISTSFWSCLKNSTHINSWPPVLCHCRILVWTVDK